MPLGSFRKLQFGAGELDRLVKLQQLSRVNSYGDTQSSYGTIGNPNGVAARLRTIIAKEALSDGQQVSTADSEFVIRWSLDVAAISPKDQLQFYSSADKWEVYDIFDVTEIGRKEFISIKAKLRNATL